MGDKINGYDFSIKYKKGKENVVADDELSIIVEGAEKMRDVHNDIISHS